MAEYTSGRGTSWREALRRAGAVLAPRSGGRRRPWSALVPVIAGLAGLLFTTSAHTAAGTSLREDRRPELTRLIDERRTQVDEHAATAAGLQADIERRTGAEAGSDARIAEQQDRARRSRTAAGFTALRGPGVSVRLDDAPHRAGGALPGDARPDDLVVHQQDVQAVVNALWAGGAEAMTVMDVRVISTSAVRCVGNTLLLHGRVYSPPFEIAAIGDSRRLLAALNADEGVAAFRAATRAYGLGYAAAPVPDLRAPAYAGSAPLGYATATGR
jgi:uncharacterized protein YlxW (UPF0749 family)